MAKAICIEPDCNGIVVARNLCGYHYAKLRRAEVRNEKGNPARKKPRIHANSLDALARINAKAAPQQDASPQAASRHPASHIRGFSEFLSERDTRKRDQTMVRLQNEARAQGRPGGQLSMQEIMQQMPDARERPEIVRFGLAGGGRIRRV